MACYYGAMTTACADHGVCFGCAHVCVIEREIVSAVVGWVCTVCCISLSRLRTVEVDL